MKLLSNILPVFNSRFVFMIGDEGAVLVYLENGSVVRRLFAPSNTPDHVHSFLELLKAHPRSPIYVLVDMMDQSYVRHALPPVTSLGLSKLVKRRLDRDFSKDDIKGALNLGRETEGRKDWNFLLISLSHSEILKGWLNLVYELPNSFKGIYLAPVECEIFISDLDAALASINKTILPEAPPPQSLGDIGADNDKPSVEGASKKKFLSASTEIKLPRLEIGKKKKSSGAAEDAGVKSQWQILVCHNKIGGFRQVVLKNGKLIFTRLTQTLNESQPEVLAGNVEQEVLNTIEYLKRLSYNPKTGLDIYIIVEQEVKSSVSTLRFGTTNAHVLTPFEASELLQLKQAVLSGDRFSDVVLATSFGVSNKHRLKLNSDYTARVSSLEMSQLGLRGGAAAAIFALLAYCGYSAISLGGISGKNGDLQQEQRTNERSLAALNEASTQLPADVDEVVDMMFFYEVLTEKQSTLLEFIKELSGIIDDNSLVTSLSWNASNIINPTRDPKNSQKLQISLSIEMVYTEENWEAFQAKFDGFVKRFQEIFPNYEVTHGNLPGSFSTDDNLKVNFEDLESQRAGPPPGEIFNITININGPLEQTPADASVEEQQGSLLPTSSTATQQFAMVQG